MLINTLTALLSSRQIVFYVETLGKISTVQLNCLIYDKLLKIACYNKGVRPMVKPSRLPMDLASLADALGVDTRELSLNLMMNTRVI